MKFSETKDFQRIPVIYGIKNVETNKWYIGSCDDMKDRFQRHRYYLRHNAHHSAKLQRSYNLHGEDAFDIQILKFLTEDNIKDRFRLEEEYIKKYDSVNNGYNMIGKCPDVERFTLSKSAKENFMKYIKTLEKSVMAINRFTGEIEGTFESVIAAANAYHTSSSNVSRTCQGVFHYIKDRVFIYTKDFDETKDYRVEHHMKGVPKSLEWRKKASAGNKNKATIDKVDKDGNVVCTYDSFKQAVEQNNFKSVDWLRHRVAYQIAIDGFLYQRRNIKKRKPAA